MPDVTKNKDSFFKKWITIFKKTVEIFSNVNGMKFSASLAYYTMFSIAPLLLLVITTVTIVLGDAAIQGEIYEPMQEIIGSEGALMLQNMIKGLKLNSNSALSMTISIVTLLVGATGVFGDLQSSINKIWDIKPKPKRGWLKMLKDRLLSSSLVLSLGFLLIVSFLVNGIVTSLMDVISRVVSLKLAYTAIVVEMVLNFFVLTFLLAIIFKFLPDVRLKWKTVRSGAVFTALLFMIGRFGINYYISLNSNISIYGAAGSIIVILIWVYYSAAIMYLGASFTRAYAEYKGMKIIPADYAVIVEEQEYSVDPLTGHVTKYVEPKKEEKKP